METFKKVSDWRGKSQKNFHLVKKTTAFFPIFYSFQVQTILKKAHSLIYALTKVCLKIASWS